MKKRKVGKVNHGFLYKKRKRIKATQGPSIMNKRKGRNAFKDMK